MASSSAMGPDELQLEVDLLDESVDQMDPADDDYRRQLRKLSELCGSLGRIPSSYVLHDELIFPSQHAYSYGGFSDVWKAQHHNEWVAFKMLRIHAGDQLSMKKAFFHEATYWKHLKHPHIVRFLGLSSQLPFSIVSEWMANGDIMSYLEENPEINRLTLIAQTASALEYMHWCGVVHGDVKGRNILINSQGQACLSDFGLAVTVYRTQSLAMLSGNGCLKSAGTTRWCAPELLSPTDDPKHTMPTTASDVYSFGIMMWEVYTGQVPFNNFRQEYLVPPKILEGLRPPQSQSQIPSSLWSLMEDCWAHERLQRPSSAAVTIRLRQELTRESQTVGSLNTQQPRPVRPPSPVPLGFGRCTGKKKALLIGVNYRGTDLEISGAIEDAKSMEGFLTKNYGFVQENITVLTDSAEYPDRLPTRKNILGGIRWLVHNACKGDSLVFLFSGHGWQQFDIDGDERDGQDDVIAPLDYETGGVIVDDELHELMVKPLPKGCQLVALVDACNSGSALDLPYEYDISGRRQPSEITPAFMLEKTGLADVITWSGYKDKGKAHEDENDGAMVSAFTQAVEPNQAMSVLDVHVAMLAKIKNKKAPKPRLSCSHPTDITGSFLM